MEAKKDFNTFCNEDSHDFFSSASFLGPPREEPAKYNLNL